MNSNFDLSIEEFKNSDGIPNYKPILDHAKQLLFTQWRSEDCTRESLTKFPRGIFRKDHTLKKQWDHTLNKVNTVYNDWMSDIYCDWTSSNCRRPYLNSTDSIEYKLARWFSKQLRRGHPPQHILELHKE